MIEVTATLHRVGTRSRGMGFEARVLCRARPELSGSAAAVLEPPLPAVTASGTVVVPPAVGG